MIRHIPGLPCLAACLLWTACQTPSRDEVDTAVSRTPKGNPHDKPAARQVVEPHRATPLEATAAVLTARLADQLPALLSQLVRLPTVAPVTEPQVDAFFNALDAQAVALGLQFTRVTPLSAEITLDATVPGSTRSVGFLVHGDVVAPGAGWTVDPFGGALKEGRLYGRGALGGKGPLVAAMAAMAAFAGSRLERPFVTRLLVGMAQKTSWACMEGHLKVRPPPDFTMALDGVFPVVTGEKGQATVKLVQRRTPANATQGCVLSAVDAPAGPRSASAQLTCAPQRATAVAASLGAIPGVTVTHLDAQVTVTTTGARAVELLVTALNTAPLEMEASGSMLLEMLQSHVVADAAGEYLGVAGTHARFTPNTVTLNKLRGDGTLWVATLTVRFAPPMTVDGVLESVKTAVARHASTVGRPATLLVDGSGLPPLDVDPKRAEVTALLRAYETVTAQPAQPVTLSSTTYAKALPNAVAFGPVFPGETDTRGGADESISNQHLFLLARIYAAALMELGGHQTTKLDYRDTNPR